MTLDTFSTTSLPVDVFAPSYRTVNMRAMRPAYLIQTLEREFQSLSQGLHVPAMLWGPPGVGKSQIVRDTGDRHGVTVIDLRLSQLEPSDLRGIPFRVGDAVQWATPAMLPDADRDGDRGILFLDELTSAPPSVTAAAYQLILDRRLGEYHLPEGWAVIAAGNRQGDRGVTYVMPAPLANRFSHYDVDVNVDDWVAWAYRQAIDAHVIGFIRFRPELLFAFDHERNPSAFPTPRSWEFVHRALAKFGDAPTLLPGAIAGCIGDAAATEFLAYRQHIDDLPSPADILRGEAVAPPQDIDLQYALAAALVAAVVRIRDEAERHEATGHVLNYASAFAVREMGVMLVADLHRQLGRAVFEVPQFDEWAGQVADILLDKA